MILLRFVKFYPILCFVFVFALSFGVNPDPIEVEPDQIGPVDVKWIPPKEADFKEEPGKPEETGVRGTVTGPIMGARRQPQGALSGVIVYCSAGHGWTADGVNGWCTLRPLLHGMVEDYGNIDQLNFFVNYCFNAGATVVPMRPVGYQTNEIVIDNDDPQVTWTGSWTNSTSTNFYGSPGDVPYRYTNISATETARARYTPTIPATGYYPVYSWARTASDRVSQLYRIVHSGGTTEVRINHRRVGGGWVWLGTYYFEAGTGGYLEISNQSSEGTGIVIADAIRFGNGMGDIDRGAGVSGFERELESNRYWIQNTIDHEQGGDSSIYDLVGYNDADDGVGAPPKMAAYMNRSADGAFWDRVYLGFHTNCCTARGAMGLYNTVDAPTSQTALALYVANEVNDDMEALDNGVGFDGDWNNTCANLYGQNYGEIRGANLNWEMSGTIIEVAFHDVLDDANLMKDPEARNAAARACYQGIVKFLNDGSGGAIPLALLPNPPTNVRAINNGDGTVTVSWNASPVDAAGGDAATGYVVYRSTNGYGFDNPILVSGGATTSVNPGGLTPGEVYYFQVSATNAGGESLPTETVAVRVNATTHSSVLIVNGFDRFNRYLCPTTYVSQNLGSIGASGGDVSLVRPLRMNSFDYVIQYAKALEELSYDFDSCSNEAIISSQVNLSNYDAVLWICGEEATADATFTAAEQTLVQTYLNSGGNLFVSGSEIGWDLDYSNNGRSFYENYLKSDYAGDDAETYSAAGVGGSIFSGIGSLSFSVADGAPYDAEFPDQLSPLAGATACLSYVGGIGGNAGLQVNTGTYKAVNLGFPFECIASSSIRQDMMQQVMSFFGVSVTGVKDWTLY